MLTEIFYLEQSITINVGQSISYKPHNAVCTLGCTITSNNWIATSVWNVSNRHCLRPLFFLKTESWESYIDFGAYVCLCHCIISAVWGQGNSYMLFFFFFKWMDSHFRNGKILNYSFVWKWRKTKCTRILKISCCSVDIPTNNSYMIKMSYVFVFMHNFD